MSPRADAQEQTPKSRRPRADAQEQTIERPQVLAYNRYRLSVARR